MLVLNTISVAAVDHKSHMFSYHMDGQRIHSFEHVEEKLEIYAFCSVTVVLGRQESKLNG